MDDVPNDPLGDLEKKIAETSRSRFVAAKRLERRDQTVSWVVSMASSYVIILTVVPYLICVSVDVADTLNLATVAMSVVTLVSSLIVGARRDAVNAEQHHRSGLELNEVKDDVVLLRASRPDEQKILEQAAILYKRYRTVLQKFSVNHDEIDYSAVMIDRPHEYPWLGWWGRQRLKVKIVAATNVSMLVMIALTVLFCCILTYAIWMRLPRA